MVHPNDKQPWESLQKSEIALKILFSLGNNIYVYILDISIFPYVMLDIYLNF